MNTELKSVNFVAAALFITCLFSFLSTPTRVVAAVPTGYLDIANGTLIAGWARDADVSNSIPVHIYVDGTFFDATTANIYRSDVGAHGFSYNHTALGAGNHTVSVYAIGVNSLGQPDGQNPLLGIKTVAGSCSGFPVDSSARGWCQYVGSYWINRQADTKRLSNNNVLIGINNSYGGSITQFYSNDRSINLVNEHGGGFYQLSLYGNATAAPYNNQAQQSNMCDALSATSVWGYILNPIQARGAGCRFDVYNGNGTWSNEPTNDVDSASAVPGGWYIRHQDVYNWNRRDVGFPGLKFEQTVTLGDVYAKVIYTVTNGTQVATASTSEQEIPAIHTGYGINNKVYEESG